MRETSARSYTFNGMTYPGYRRNEFGTTCTNTSTNSTSTTSWLDSQVKDGMNINLAILGTFGLVGAFTWWWWRSGRDERGGCERRAGPHSEVKLFAWDGEQGEMSPVSEEETKSLLPASQNVVTESQACISVDEETGSTDIYVLLSDLISPKDVEVMVTTDKGEKISQAQPHSSEVHIVCKGCHPSPVVQLIHVSGQLEVVSVIHDLVVMDQNL